jgi:hypothetical protein
MRDAFLLSRRLYLGKKCSKAMIKILRAQLK